jgi:type I restriction enzyme S subunit
MSEATLSPQDLPTSWAITTLGAVVDYGKTDKVEPSELAASDWVLELEDIEKDSSRLLQRVTFATRQSKSTKNRFQAGDVLYGKLRPYLNKVLIADGPGCCTTEILPLKARVHIDNRYLFYWLKHPAFLKYVEAESHGMNMPRLGTETGKAAPFVLAPRPEQTRIADQLGTLLARVQACNDRFDAIPVLLKRFRQTVLRAALTGTLTSASAWQVCKIKDAGKIQLGRQRAPKFHSGKNMRPYLRVQNVFENRLDLSDVMEMDFPGADFERYQLHPGDILLNEGQSPEYLGRPAMYHGELPGACFTNTLIRFQAYPHVNPEFALLVFRHHMHSGRYIVEGNITTNLAHLSAGRFGEVEFPLPTLKEQTEIVRRVEALFAMADRIEACCTVARAQAQRLTPLLLAKAFRGELVPQDPNDEPASELLARIAPSNTVAAGKHKRKCL